METKTQLTTAQKITAEIKSLLGAMIFFTVWLGSFIVMKTWVLEEYHIEFHGISVLLIGALVLSKVVLILEHVSLGSWMKRQPAWCDVLARTLLYALGVLVVMTLEKTLEIRHEQGGMAAALESVIRGVHRPHLMANVLCISGALLVFNGLSVIRRQLGPGNVMRLFTRPIDSFDAV
jgi:hypothetical protein